jgi:hypothetical protein
MALASTSRAIGAVTQTLRERLTSLLGATVDQVTVGRPEPPAGNILGSRLNLFLYEIHVDEYLRNLSLDEGQPAPLWLVLHYLITAFDENGESDNIEAHDIIGAAMRVLHAINFLQPTAGTSDPLRDNPNELKVTFDAATADLLSKLMQGPDMKYRCSAAFQVRPVLLAPSEPPVYSQLVGVDYTAGGALIGERGIHIGVEPSLGPSLTSVVPAKFEPGATLQITGDDLHLEGITMQMADVVLPIANKSPSLVQCVVPLALKAGNLLPAGSQAITAVQTLPTGRKYSSNAITGGLLPHVDTATPSGVTPIDPSPGAPVTAVIDLTGFLLSTSSDAVFLGLSRDGTVVRLFDQFTRPTADQKTLRLTIATEAAVPPGTYRIILRVNGQQALNSPAVTL